nr:hypothetical protein [Lachnospiraceae bacterium]
MKKNGVLKIILFVVLGIFALFGIFFLIIMLLPEDEGPGEDRAETVETEEYEADEESEEKEPGKDGSEKENKQGKKTDERPTVTVGTDAKSATVMVYMNGSDLESMGGEASIDISEMLKSGVGETVNVIIQTMGTKKWNDYDISSRTAQTYRAVDGSLELLRDDLGKLDCTKAETLSEFIDYCKTEYPADRYIMLFWDHGGGPVYGFGKNEWGDSEESLTVDEMIKAFKENEDVHFDIIGMDCCIMGSLETVYSFEPFCKYALLSEDFESQIGWDYTGWMKKLEEDPGISTPLLGKYIVDEVVESNEESEYGDSVSIGLYNETSVKNLFSAWKEYAYKNEEDLLGTNFSHLHTSRGKQKKDFFDQWTQDESDVTLSDYYISDILAIVENIDNESDEAKALTSALKATVAYFGHSGEKNELTGLAISLPYGDPYFYEELKKVYSRLGLDKDYIEWLESFVDAENTGDFYDYSDFE